MKITITKDTFLENLQIVQAGVSARTTLPILQNFLIEAVDNKLKLSRTDMEMATIHHTKAEVIEEGSITIPLKEFSEILKTLPADKEITIEVASDNKVHIKSGKSKFWVIGAPKSEYPVIPEMEKSKTIIVPATIINDAIQKTIFSCSSQETRYVLNGLLWNKEKDLLEIVATDGRRLAHVTVKDLDKEQDFKIIVPSKILGEISRFLNMKKPTDKDELAIKVSSNQISFGMQDTTFMSRLIEGNFPNYKQVIPAKGKISFESLRTELLATTRRAALCSSDLGGTVEYTLEDSVLKISSSSQKMDFNDEMKIEYTGEAFNASFNPQYVVDVLKNLSCQKVIFSFISEDQPVLIETAEDDKYKYVIMPVRT
ncbi:MAG: DNA polymerase III subunit beta [Elusimicrobiaceae bacterium]|nr:DNA polymerase III subunit beta [Elusimicrobiaceae bacterium]